MAPIAPQFRSQRTEPLIPNPLHCIKYCVDAALFWLPTQILICKMLIKSEIKGWEQYGLKVLRAMEAPLRPCWGEVTYNQSFTVLILHHMGHDLLQNFPPLFLKTSLRMTHVHIWRQGEGTHLFFRRKWGWRWAALSTVGRPHRARGTAVTPWGVPLDISHLMTTWVSTAQFCITKIKDNWNRVRFFF